MSNTPAGWYPQEDGRQRFWDGEHWTEHFAPGTAEAEATAPMPAQPAYSVPTAGSVEPVGRGRSSGVRPWFKKKRFIIPAGLMALVVMFSTFTGGGEGDPVEASGSDSSPTATAPATPTNAAVSPKPSASPTPAKAAPAPATKAPAPAPAEPELSAAQKNAVRTAESYLDMAGFSQEGLIAQLEFEGYSAKDAKAALGTMDVDWNEEAAQSAKSYTEMTGFSRSGLIEQLEFEGYTKAQATFGADSVGL